MLTLCLCLSATIYGFMQRFMPTNRAIVWLHTPLGLRWAIPVALIATPAYLGLTAVAIEGAQRPGLGWLNVLVVPFFWNAMKFAWMAVLSPLLLVKLVAGRLRGRRMPQTRALAESSRAVRAPRERLARASCDLVTNCVGTFD